MLRNSQTAWGDSQVDAVGQPVWLYVSCSMTPTRASSTKPQLPNPSLYGSELLAKPCSLKVRLPDSPTGWAVVPRLAWPTVGLSCHAMPRELPMALSTAPT